jgi:hypothetical protein
LNDTRYTPHLCKFRKNPHIRHLFHRLTQVFNTSLGNIIIASGTKASVVLDNARYAHHAPMNTENRALCQIVLNWKNV